MTRPDAVRVFSVTVACDRCQLRAARQRPEGGSAGRYVPKLGNRLRIQDSGLLDLRSRNR